MNSTALTHRASGQGPAQRRPLVVLYDERCPLCRRLRAWLAGQATLAPIEYLAAASTEARRRFPALDHERTKTVLTVVRADGAVYEGERAWLVTAWLLPRWQPLAEHLASPGRLLAVRFAAHLVDGVRLGFIDRHRPKRAYRAPDGECTVCRVAAPARLAPDLTADRGAVRGPWPPPARR